MTDKAAISRPKDRLAMLSPRPVDPGIAMSPYNGFVRVMQWLLPTLALGFALMIVLWPILNEQEMSFTLSREDVVTSDDKIRIIRPVYRGSDHLDRPFRIAAQSGVQDSPDAPRIMLTGIEAEIALDDATTALMRADNGVFYTREDRLEMEGTVRFETSDGNHFEARAAEFDLTTHIAKSEAPISGKGPLGSFSARAFEINVDEATAIFHGGVRLRLDPTGRLDMPYLDFLDSP